MKNADYLKICDVLNFMNFYNSVDLPMICPVLS